ncbi:Msx2-Interacting Protein [Manis pentadactyla]|nr:Msx2-Interacting Protein [Manis pentadactyla]
MLVPPAGTARFRCPPCFFPKVLSQTQQRKLPACARPLVSPAPPPQPPSLAKAQAPSNSDRLRLPPAGSRGLPRQGPAPSSSRRPVLLAAAAHGFPRSHAGLANLQQPQLIVSTGNNFLSLNSLKFYLTLFCKHLLLSSSRVTRGGLQTRGLGLLCLHGWLVFWTAGLVTA